MCNKGKKKYTVIGYNTNGDIGMKLDKVYAKSPQTASNQVAKSWEKATGWGWHTVWVLKGHTEVMGSMYGDSPIKQYNG